MADWELSEFNKNLLDRTYTRSVDRPEPHVLPPPMPLPPAVRPLSEEKPLWYTGPSALTPESMANMVQYYRERPGAFLEKPVKFLVVMAAAAGMVTGFLLLVMLTSNLSKFFRSRPNVNAVGANMIGIVNPAWVARKTTAIGAKNGATGFFDFAADDRTGVAYPDKFIYVSPEEAQRDLEKLIKMGYVSAKGAPPNVVRDFETLKGMGITTGAGIAVAKS